MYGEHVTAETGTGLVHTAPGHGYEDFVVGAKYGLEPFTPVDSAGVFTAEGGQWAGRNVFEANDSIVARLRETGALLAMHTISHSYPHCWRCHKPLIFRATEQWFMRIDHEGLREKVIGEIDGARWVPGWSRDRIRNMTETRPDWCLSRQRAWGVPIPALRCAGCGNVILDSRVMKIAEAIFAKEGSDAWFERPVGDFAPAGLTCPKCSGAAFIKEEDVLDVWFDSGCSQAAVLAMRPELSWPADAYLEAVEQARGWFSSSLTCAVARARRGAVSQRHQPRADGRRAGAQDVEVARQHRGRARRREPPRRRRDPAGVCVARLHDRDFARRRRSSRRCRSRTARFATPAAICSATCPTSIRRATRSRIRRCSSSTASSWRVWSGSRPRSAARSRISIFRPRTRHCRISSWST